MKGGGVTGGRCSPGWESGLPLGLCWVDRGRATVFLVVVARVDQLLSKSFLSFKAAPLGPWLFGGIFSLVLVVSRLPASSASSLGYVSQNQNPGNSSATPQVLGSPAGWPSSPPSRVLFCLLYIC